MKAFTDYPFKELGDETYKEAPIREVEVISYDSDKYCLIKVDGILTDIKRFYLYTQPGRLNEVPVIDHTKLPINPNHHEILIK